MVHGVFVFFLFPNEMAVFPQSWEAPQVHLGGTSGAHSRSVQTLEPSTVSPSSFLSVDGATARQELGLSYRNRRLRFRGGLGFKLVLGAIASAAAVAVLIALCAAASHRTAPLRVTRRRLSEGMAPKSTPGLVACGETSGAGPGDDPQAPLQEEKVEPQPAKKARVEGEVSDAGDEAGSQAQTSASGQAESTSAAAGTAVIPPEAESCPESRLSPGAVMAAQALIALWGARAPAFSEQAARGPAFHGQAQLTPASEQEMSTSAVGAAVSPPKTKSPLESRMCPDEVMAAQALIALWGAGRPAPQEHAALGPIFQGQEQLPPVPQQQLQLLLAVQQQALPPPEPQQHGPLPPAPQQQAGAAPPLARVSVPPILPVSKVPVQVMTSSPGLVSSTSTGVEGPQPQPPPFQLAAPCPVGPCEEPSQGALTRSPVSLRGILLSSNKELEIIDPLGEWEPPPPDGEGGRAVLEHAFSRLPAVLGGDHSTYCSFINIERAFSMKRSPPVQVPLMREMRTLLAQQRLSFDQVRRVGEIAELFLGHLYLNEGRPLGKSPCTAVETLAFRFLVLDMTVAALQLLGVPRSGPWWDQLVSHIPDEYNQTSRKWIAGLPLFNVKLLSRLTTATRILKAGNRPAPTVLTHLKRCLFCSQHSPIRFLKPEWDSWREDNRRYYQQLGGRAGRSDPAEPGPSHQSASWGDA
ncbi:hypothetical protein Esti_004783 [Eimeria stiedai]